MHVFDRYGDNYFSDTISLIMNFEPYVHRVVLGRPIRTPEHRIILVRQGTTTINVSYNNYTLKEGHLLIIPANSVLIKEAQSDGYNVFCVAFRIPEVERLGLIDYKEKHIVLSDSECRVVENYFRLMEQVIRSKSIHQHGGVIHLIISLLYGIYDIYEELARPISPARPDRSLEIMNNFTRLLMVQEFPTRKPEYYANELNITKGHLADVVKEKSGKTTMEWINERTALLAKAMLTSSNEILEGIAEKLHFSDASQFIKFFKKQIGETPSEYRKRMQAKG
ncbi:MAG: AraC family transcriptional regulator [Bacteroidales bacterium]|nr:AraC family transcriptional regulator [Bacteroidales bacterium]